MYTFKTKDNTYSKVQKLKQFSKKANVFLHGILQAIGFYCLVLVQKIKEILKKVQDFIYGVTMLQGFTFGFSFVIMAQIYFGIYWFYVKYFIASDDSTELTDLQAAQAWYDNFFATDAVRDLFIEIGKYVSNYNVYIDQLREISDHCRPYNYQKCINSLNAMNASGQSVKEFLSDASKATLKGMSGKINALAAQFGEGQAQGL